MNKIRRLAEKQWDALNEGNDEDLIGFEYEGQYIVNPWMDPSGRFELSTEEAVNLYGELNMIHFCEDLEACNE